MDSYIACTKDVAGIEKKYTNISIIGRNKDNEYIITFNARKEDRGTIKTDPNFIWIELSSPVYV